MSLWSGPIPDQRTACAHHRLSLHVLPASHRKRLCRDRVLPGEASRIQRGSPENLRASLGRKQAMAAHRVLPALRHNGCAYRRGLSRSSCNCRRDVRRSRMVQNRTPRLDPLGLSVGSCPGRSGDIREKFGGLDSESPLSLALSHEGRGNLQYLRDVTSISAHALAAFDFIPSPLAGEG